MAIRVLVVDDSAFARKVVREVLSTHPDLEVVDIARDGADALEKIATYQPDVVTLDLLMPVIDGLGVLRALASSDDAPRVVVVSVSGADTDLGIQALQLGAIAVVRKPTSLATDRLYDLDKELIATVLAAATAHLKPARRRPAPPAPSRPAPTLGRTRLLAIGTSTGGPPAITRLLTMLPADLAVPIAIVVHLPVEYTDAFARRLDASTGFRVREAEDGLPLGPGEVVLARGGIHLTFATDGEGVVVRLTSQPSDGLYRPSVNVTFVSAAAVYGAGVLGVVLTGMGDDGTEGARAIRAAGGRTLTEAESSCVVYGMPRCVVEANLSDGSATLEDMPRLILDNL